AASKTILFMVPLVKTSRGGAPVALRARGRPGSVREQKTDPGPGLVRTTGVIGDQRIKLVRTSLVTCGVVGAVVGVVVLHERPARAGTAFAPDPAQVRYRFGLDASDSRAEITGRIAALERRIATEARSPFDLEELAQHYLRRAQLDDDRRDHDRAEAMATR